MITSLLIPVYRELTQRFKNSLLGYLRARVEGLDVELKIEDVDEWYTTCTLKGNDEHTAALFLKKELGGERHIDELTMTEEYAGNFYEIGDTALTAHIGIRNPRFLISIPFKTFLEGLFGGSTLVEHPRETFLSLGLREYFPLHVKVETLIPVGRENYLSGKPSSETLSLLKEWLHLPYNRVFVYGETRGKIKEALSKSGHGHDVLNIERWGFLECSIVCKKDTSAVGLIPEIGPFLEEAELTAFQVDSILEELNEKTH
ncbi:MAG: DUF2110 family protein [Candidatus Korarchaeota archaeon]|nr:DUF2110 family protein [Candidatus Korarchaeota archaeon]NIU82732.1 DUF2110 family protein [Candidatus Thorarchaeota archaeon]NIW14154.1 DUF2110 family protein [Candidatus Thorarchaeota archaeon]NIW52257.1 DUF2110 family protein [Candidatus Korarchaeota archaeon]